MRKEERLKNGAVWETTLSQCWAEVGRGKVMSGWAANSVREGYVVF